MKRPSEVTELAGGIAYGIPKYKMTNNGLEGAGEAQIYFLAGTKDNEDGRSEGILPSSLLFALAKKYEKTNPEMAASFKTLADAVSVSKTDLENKGL